MATPLRATLPLCLPKGTGSLRESGHLRSTAPGRVPPHISLARPASERRIVAIQADGPYLQFSSPPTANCLSLTRRTTFGRALTSATVDFLRKSDLSSAAESACDFNLTVNVNVGERSVADVPSLDNSGA